MKQSNTFFDRSLDKGRLKQLIRWTFEHYGAPAAVDLVERLKNRGFRAAASAGISLGVEDLRIPLEKRRATKRSELVVRFSELSTSRGASTVAERSQARVQAWARASESRKNAIVDTFRSEDPLSPLYRRAFSGARGNRTQVRQLIGRRGLRVDPLGRLVEFPIRSNFKEGRTLTEFLISCYGARKGIVDTALRTATAGYLTRRLVDVGHYQVIGRLDCGTRRAIRIQPLRTDDGRILTPLAERLVGRALARPRPGIAPRNTFVTHELAERLTQRNRNPWVRSALSCRATSLGPRPERFQRQRYLSADLRDPAPRLRGFSLCQRCYGWSLADAGLVHLGEAVGILAAQSIGEPGTQLTRRTFHTGGVFSAGGASSLRATRPSKVSFAKPRSGRLARTRSGRVGFLTREGGLLILTSLQGDKKLELPIPPLTLLFVREGQKVGEGVTLGEKTVLQTIREGEVIVRRNRTSHGGQLVYQDLDEKLPKGKTVTEWSSIPRTENFSRIRLLGGEVVDLPVRGQRSGSFPFKKGDVLSPSAASSTVRVRSLKDWKQESSQNQEISRYGQSGTRHSYQKGVYRWNPVREAYLPRFNQTQWKGLSTQIRQGVFSLTPLRTTPPKKLEVCPGVSRVWKPTAVNLSPKGKKRDYQLREAYARATALPRARKQLPLAAMSRKPATGSLERSPKRKSRSARYQVMGATSTSRATPSTKASTCHVGKYLPTPALATPRRFTRRVNKQVRSWLPTNTRVTAQRQAKCAVVSVQTLDSNEKLLATVTKRTPGVQLLGQRTLRSYFLDRWKTYRDAQGFNARYGWRGLNQPTHTRGLLNARANEWGEFVAQQPRQNFQLRQLFIGRTNVGAIPVQEGAKIQPLGSYCSPPQHVSGPAGPLWPGYFISYHRGAAVVRRTTDWNLPPDTLIRGASGDLIARYWPLTASRGRSVETGDITSGIPRVEALLEARERSGIRPFVQGLFQQFTDRGESPRLAVRKSIHAAQRAIIDNVQRIYRTNGVVIDDKHIELIVRPRGYGEVSRDSSWHEPLARGEVHPIDVLERANQLRALYNLTKATDERDRYPRIEYQPLILGLTRASLLTTSESFLSAASFQETSRVLARSGVRGRTDYLLGLKENLILGTRLPIGTAARHLLLTPPTEKKESDVPMPTLPPGTPRTKTRLLFGSNRSQREEFIERRWNDRPSLPKDPTWRDALVYLGESLDTPE